MNTIGLAGVVISGIVIAVAIAYVLLYVDVPAATFGCFIGLLAGSILFAEYAMLAGWWPEGPLIAVLPMIVFLIGGTFLGGFLAAWFEDRKIAR